MENVILYKSCFDKNFWKSAVNELKNVKTLIICALFAALRIAVKPLGTIAIAGVKILSIDYFVNALGSMIYGPVAGLIVGAISDTVGELLFPSPEGFFFPYIFVEMTSSFIFGLFLYKQDLTSLRVILSRVTVIIICNLIMTPTVNYLAMTLTGTEKAFTLINTVRIIKNVCIMPLDSVLLILYLRALALPLTKLGYISANTEKLKIKAKEIVFLVILSIIAISTVTFYILYKKGIVTL